MSTVKSPPGRRRAHRGGVRTRLQILRAAEQLIADKGFDAASLRDVTSLAGVELGLVNYHFGSKEGLYIAVLSRRNSAINRIRLKRLEEAKAKAAPNPVEIGEIVDAFLDPIFDRLTTNAPGWRNWGRVAARINWSPPIFRHQSETMDPVGLAFIAEFARALPHVRPGSLYFRYVFMISVLMEVLHGAPRVSNLSNGTEDIRNLAVARKEARDFILTGFNAP